jgi:hypothetical protein
MTAISRIVLSQLQKTTVKKFQSPHQNLTGIRHILQHLKTTSTARQVQSLIEENIWKCRLNNTLDVYNDYINPLKPGD